MIKTRQKGFNIDGWQVSPSEGVLSRGSDIVHLEPKAMEVLVYFASRPNTVISREELERDVWHGALVGYDAVTNTIIKLRKALQDNARQPRFIATIPKKGYQLIAAVTYSETDKPTTEIDSSVVSQTIIETPRQHRSWFTNKKGLALNILVSLFLIGLVWFWSQDSNNHTELPSIVVLPFENLSDDVKQEYLADGITEDIITDLSRISNLLVIASNTSIKYKNKQVIPEKVGADLNVGYVLKGSIRQVGNTVRVNAQLVNTKTGFNAWAERYDRKITEVFAVQDEVTQSIVNALAVKITNQEKQRLAHITTNSLKAYDFFQEGQRFYKNSTKESFELARDMYRKAIELDPGYGRAYGAIAVTLAADFRRGWTDSPIATLDQALVLALKAVELDDATPQTYFALSFVYFQRKEFDKAIKASEQSIKVAPNYADGYGMLALIYSYYEQPKKSIELTNKAILLNPFYTYEYMISYGVAYYALGNYTDAIKVLEQAQERNENAIPVKVALAASYVRANQQHDAEWAINEIQVLNPGLTINSLSKTIPFSSLELKHAMLDDLRKAGMPE